MSITLAPMDEQVAARVELAVRTRLYESLVSEFGTLNAAVVRLGLPAAKTYRHLEPGAKNGTKKIPFADIVIFAEKLHDYDPGRFQDFGHLWADVVAHEL